MQEVFLRAWQHLDKVAGLPEDGQRGWLFTVARNLSVDSARHQRTADGAQRALEREPSGRQASGRRPGQHRGAGRRARGGRGGGDRDAARAAAGHAGHGRRRRLNSAEIGAALGVPAGTVRYRLSLARRTLAEALGDYDDPKGEQ